MVHGSLDADHAVDVIVLNAQDGHFGALPEGARVARVRTGHAWLAVPVLARYLQRTGRRALLVAKDRAGRPALRARQRARAATRVVFRMGNTLSRSLEGWGWGWLWRWLRYRPIRRLYWHADAIVAVSRGVAEVVVDTSGVDPAGVHTSVSGSGATPR